MFLNADIDESFPAHGPNPLLSGATRQARAAVREHHADVGVVFDADGDRAVFIDDAGRDIDPDDVLFLLARARRGPFLIDVRTGWRVRRHIPKARWRVTPVGHTNIKRAMRAKRVAFAGERSGHYYFRPAPGLYVDSGILAANELLSLVSASRPPLSAIIDALPRYCRSGEINFRVRDAQSVIAKIERAYRLRALSTHVDGLTVERDSFWFNLRPSGTESFLRLNMEAETPAILHAERARIRALLHRQALLRGS